jgi:hypothetical protein
MTITYRVIKVTQYQATIPDPKDSTKSVVQVVAQVDFQVVADTTIAGGTATTVFLNPDDAAGYVPGQTVTLSGDVVDTTTGTKIISPALQA